MMVDVVYYTPQPRILLKNYTQIGHKYIEVEVPYPTQIKDIDMFKMQRGSVNLVDLAAVIVVIAAICIIGEELTTY